MSSQRGSSTASPDRCPQYGDAPAHSALPVCGIEPTSLIDYPSHVCATLFVSGCNFRCPYCHNSSLVVGSPPRLNLSEITDFLRLRARTLDGVCITGGEPTLHMDLEAFAAEIKKLGLKVKLDTNGANPRALARLLEQGLVDYVAVDVKAPKGRYGGVVRMPSPFGDVADVAALVESSIKTTMASGVEYELRTTVCPSILDIDDILEIGRWLKGARRYVLQQYFSTRGVLDPETAGRISYPSSWFADAVQRLSGCFDEILVRGV